MRIAVIGTGYLGAVHAAAMADLGHEVLGVDTDVDKVELLGAGRPSFFEPGLAELLNSNIANGRLRFTTSFADAADFADIHFICVGTPQLPGSRAADLSYLESAVYQLGPRLRRRCVIVGKSTVPVGTATRMRQLLDTLVPDPRMVSLLWNPEFLREGFAIKDTLAPDRIVVGMTEPDADRDLRTVYAPMVTGGSDYITTDLATAELVKVAANAFLATKISFINAMAEICEATGADVTTLAEAIGRDERIGPKFLRAGVGFGGGCLGKDIRAFEARAQELGVPETLRFLSEVDQINNRQRERTVRLATELVGGDVAGRRIAVLGAAFKPNSDDVRDSPALHVAAALHDSGAAVRVHDPEAIENARAAYPQLDYADDVPKAVELADLVIHLTEWGEYRSLDPRSMRDLVCTPRLLDGRNALDTARWISAGWTVTALGRSL